MTIIFIVFISLNKIKIFLKFLLLIKIVNKDNNISIINIFILLKFLLSRLLFKLDLIFLKLEIY